MGSKDNKEVEDSPEIPGPGLPLTFSPLDRRPGARVPTSPPSGYHANAVYSVELVDSSGLLRQLRLCSRWNRGFCSRQGEPRCRWVPGPLLL